MSKKRSRYEQALVQHEDDEEEVSSADEESGDEEQEDAEQDQQQHPKRLQIAFSRKGVVCHVSFLLNPVSIHHLKTPVPSSAWQLHRTAPLGPPAWQVLTSFWLSLGHPAGVRQVRAQGRFRGLGVH